MSPSNLESRFQTLHEIVRAAHMNLAPGPWDYLAGGTAHANTTHGTSFISSASSLASL